MHKWLEPELLRHWDRLTLASRRKDGGPPPGHGPSRRHGRSPSFAEHRPYAEGDDPRRVDWTLYGRLDRLFTKLSTDEGCRRVHLLLDASRSMDTGSPGKLRYARRLAAALACAGMNGHHRVQIHVWSDGRLSSSPPWAGKSRRFSPLAFLDLIQAGGPTRMTAMMAEFLRRGGGRGNLVAVLSDWLDPDSPEKALGLLAASGSETYLFHVLSPDELDPALEGDCRLVDLEDGAEHRVAATPSLLARYRETLAGFQDRLRAGCRRRGIVFLAAPAGDAAVFPPGAPLRRAGLSG